MASNPFLLLAFEENGLLFPVCVVLLAGLLIFDQRRVTLARYDFQLLLKTYQQSSTQERYFYVD